jgi:hypothetical protein
VKATGGTKYYLLINGLIKKCRDRLTPPTKNHNFFRMRGISSSPARSQRDPAFRRGTFGAEVWFMKRLIATLTISASVIGAVLGEITVGLPFFGVLIGAGVLLSLRD